MIASPAQREERATGEGRMAAQQGASPQVTYEDFTRVDVRVGTIVDAQPFPEARRPAFKLWVDLVAEIGVQKSSAPVPVPSDPAGHFRLPVAAVVNFPPRPPGTF